MIIFALPGAVIQFLWLNRIAQGASNLARSVYTVGSGYWYEVIINGILPSYVFIAIIVFILVKRIKIPRLMLMLLWAFSLLPILVSRLGSRFPAYFVTPASLFVAPLLDRRGNKPLAPEIAKWTILFLLSIFFSYTYFGHKHDLTIPAVSPQLRNALQWIETHTAKDTIILVNQGRTYYDGVRIYFFTKRRVTEVPASANVHLSYHSSPISSAWRLSAEFDGIHIYKRKKINEH